ncbi:ABC transporter substrate-binding protein [Lapillicoccus jejuensis]|uniref:Carbohydrate ABC transporter substrate-binding protein (CUT1 family) n=1 Tax=Lapillicoccus jejuensis TaxID=402171 RepID=A0A542E4H7_9MICO|nr:ABC transporter substrate-binding protein [Lapillicoccus jejuensis]TQJ10221.1 carbohydrate ABC transporter substrate-binding protein (CUT1 family) [Lapillicoccus jejuensis]
MSRRRGAALAVALVLTTGLAACSPGDGGSTAVPPADALGKAGGLTRISFWHEMNGTNAKVLTQLVNQFNAEHRGSIEVDPTYIGTYDDAITKYKASVMSNSTPNVVQIYDIGTRFMVDAGQTVPVQGFVDRDRYDVSDLQPNITGYYTVGGKLASMPFNTSMPVLYYNKTMFEKAGLDPNRPPTTLEEMTAAAQKLSARNGGPAKYGFGAAIYGWFLEQLLATAGDTYCDQGNGRDGLASKAEFDQPDAVTVMTWWQELVQQGLAANTGRDTKAAQNAFTSQQVAMNLESTGTLSAYSKAAKSGGFDLGVAFYPKIRAGQGGPAIGGASLWVDGPGHDDAEKEASWQFVKYLASSTIQAQWHTGTGYFPISKGALQEPVDVAYRQKNPLFDVAVKQLEQTPLSVASRGCALGVMPQSRKASEDAIEEVLNGSDPKTALSGSVGVIQKAIDRYNRSARL